MRLYGTKSKPGDGIVDNKGRIAVGGRAVEPE